MKKKISVKVLLTAAVFILTCLTSSAAGGSTVTPPAAPGTSPPAGNTWLQIAQHIPEITPISGFSDRTVPAGSDFEFTLMLSSSASLNIKPIKNFAFGVELPSGFDLMEGSLTPSSPELNKSYRFKIHVPSDTPAGRHFVRLNISYTYDYLDPISANQVASPNSIADVYANSQYISTTRNFSMVVNVSSDGTVTGGNVVLENVSLSADEVAQGEEFDVLADVFNNTTGAITEATLTITDSAGNRLARKYIGKIDAWSSSPNEMTIRGGINATGNRRLNVTLTYRDGAGSSRTLTQSTTVRVLGTVAGDDGTLRIQSASVPIFVPINTQDTVKFNLTNPTRRAIEGAEARLLDSAGKEVASIYITQIPANSSDPYEIPFDVIGKTGARKYQLVVSYKDAAGKSHTLKKTIDFTVVDPDVEPPSSGTGTLRLQNVNSPFSAALETYETLTLTLTNPTENPVSGAEVFLFDEANTELTSVYVNKIAANTSEEIALNFPVKGSKGNRTYRIEIFYKNDKDISEKITRSFSMRALTEDEAEKEEPPADIIIHKIGNPPILYTGVNTEIPYTLVNSSKGSAYNAEIFIEDENGTVLAREYVGAIKPGEPVEDKIKIKINEAGQYELTIGVVYENADESRDAARRVFEQRVSEYRASITDIGGYEWIMAGEMRNIEFSILNNGSETLSNVNAVLLDANGSSISEIFIGTIDPGTKKERQRFREVMFMEAGMHEYTISVTYENADMQEFELTNNFTATVEEMMMFPGEYPGDIKGDPGREGIFPEGEGEEGEGGGIAWWIWLVIGLGVGVPGAVVLIIFLRKRSLSRESEEMERFIKMMAPTEGAIAEPATSAEITASAAKEPVHSYSGDRESEE